MFTIRFPKKNKVTFEDLKAGDLFTIDNGDNIVYLKIVTIYKNSVPVSAINMNDFNGVYINDDTNVIKIKGILDLEYDL